MISLTEAAINQIKSLNAGDTIRVSVEGGGCSGLSYKLDFDSNPPSQADKIFETGGIKLLVDAKSYLFLSGSTLDFEGGLNGSGFQFTNPNSKRTCGCGSSFSV